MKTSHGWNIRSMSSKFLMRFVLAVMTGSMLVIPALGDDDHGRWDKHDERRHDRGHHRGSYRYEHGRRVYYPYVYREEVYVAPPPVYYAPPPPPPGIRIFLPPIVIR